MLTRRSAELALRGLGIAAVLGWVLNAALPRTSAVVSVRGNQLGDALPRWTRDGGVDAVHARMEQTPDAMASAWLRALGRAGVDVSWDGALLPTALETFGAASPAGGYIVLASSGGDTAVLSDALGSLDTLHLAGAGNPVGVRLASIEGDVTLLSGVQPARAAPAERATLKRVYIAGAAGWEAKFVIAALEEAGWEVDARLFVAPGHDVVQGSAARAALDTSRHSAVILVDSAAAESVRGVEAFARAGGGVILAGDASRARRVADLISWRAGEQESAPLGTIPADTAWRGLSRVPLVPVMDERSLAIESRGGKPVIVARRYYAGRVIGVGYDATWRWRMAGGEGSVAEHGAWWTRLVSSVAAREPMESGTEGTGAAPIAALYDRLGAPSTSANAPSRQPPRQSLATLLGLIALVALPGEWLLRRARGAR